MRRGSPVRAIALDLYRNHFRTSGFISLEELDALIPVMAETIFHSLVITLFTLAAFGVGTLVLIWLGFPIGMWVLAMIRGSRMRPDAESGSTTRVSLVLATRDSPDAIATRVRNLLDTDHPLSRLQVVVALDHTGSRATEDEVRQIPGVNSVVIGAAPGGKATALNAGVLASTGDVLIMADTAQAFDRQTVPCLAAALTDSRFGAVSGALLLGERRRLSPVDLYWRLEKWLRFNESLVHSAVGVTGAVYATRRALWQPLPPGTLLDDVYVPMSLVLRGHRVGFTYDAVARDVRVFDAAAEGGRKARTLTGVLQLLDLLPGLLSKRNPIRWTFVMHKLARLTSPVFVLFAVVGSMGVATLFVLANPRLGLALTAGLMVPLFAVGPLRRLLFATLRWVFAMQWSIVTALRNGLSRRWSVWNQR